MPAGENRVFCKCGHTAGSHDRNDASCCIDGCEGCLDEGFTLNNEE